MTTPSPRLLKASEAARCIGISRKTMYKWIAQGSLPIHRFGRTIRIAKDDLEAHIQRARLNDLATERELAAQKEVMGAVVADWTGPRENGEMATYAPVGQADTRASEGLQD